MNELWTILRILTVISFVNQLTKGKFFYPRSHTACQLLDAVRHVPLTVLCCLLQSDIV